ncbi:MAG: hypothetical protein KDA42_04485 [Planctomycetales bacterium]|nr:hypothetical protein [Planctomycetales bacterium]
MNRSQRNVACFATLLSCLIANHALASSYAVESSSVDEPVSLTLQAAPSFHAGPREEAKTLEMAPFYPGTVDGFRMTEFYTESGDIAYNADGTLAKDAKHRDIPMPTEIALGGKAAANASRVPRDYHYKSLDGTPESGGEWWLEMWQLRQPARGGVPAPADYSNYLYGGIALVIAIVVWRVRRGRQLEMEDYLDSLAERTHGAYHQSTRGGFETSNVMQLVPDNELSQYEALIGVSPLKRIRYQG